jgi:hypothetical protein
MMIQIAPRTAPNFLGPEFNRFLFALVGTDRYGAQLSVVSALARLDLDAWAEAAALARLPRDAAVKKLSLLLRRYSEIPQMAQESGAVAARLVALLPGTAATKPAVETPRSKWVAASSAAGLGLLFALAILIGLQYANEASTHAITPTSQAVSQK